MDPKVQKSIREAAEVNPEIAIKLSEHGFGRPPASLELTGPGGAPVSIGITFRFLTGIGKDGNAGE